MVFWSLLALFQSSQVDSHFKTHVSSCTQVNRIMKTVKACIKELDSGTHPGTGEHGESLQGLIEQVGAPGSCMAETLLESCRLP